jgi:RhoGAP domain
MKALQARSTQAAKRTVAVAEESRLYGQCLKSAALDRLSGAEEPSENDVSDLSRACAMLSEFSVLRAGVAESLGARERSASHLAKSFVRIDVKQVAARKRQHDKARARLGATQAKLAECEKVRRSSAKGPERYSEALAMHVSAREACEIDVDETLECASFANERIDFEAIDMLCLNFDALRDYFDRCSRWLAEHEADFERLRASVAQRRKAMASFSVRGETRIFGAPLETLAERGLEPDGTPTAVAELLDAVAARPNTVGLFRVACENATLNSTKRRLDRGERIELAAVPDAHVVPSLVKLLLRELPEPLVPSALYADFVRVADERHTDRQLATLRQLLAQPSVAPVARCTLRRLSAMCAELAANCARNKMDVHNLALIIGTNVLRNPATDDHMKLVSDMDAVIEVMALLIEHHESLFARAALPVDFEPAPPPPVVLTSSSSLSSLEPPSAPSSSKRSGSGAGIGRRKRTGSVPSVRSSRCVAIAQAAASSQASSSSSSLSPTSAWRVAPRTDKALAWRAIHSDLLGGRHRTRRKSQSLILRSSGASGQSSRSEQSGDEKASSSSDSDSSSSPEQLVSCSSSSSSDDDE